MNIVNDRSLCARRVLGHFGYHVRKGSGPLLWIASLYSKETLQAFKTLTRLTRL